MSTVIEFCKMHGLGNDFVVIDGVRQAVHLTPTQIRALADRHCGVGCDQVLIVEPAQSPDIDFHYRIFNADGSEAGQCGNGARCLAHFVHANGLTQRSHLKLQTCSTVIEVNYHQPQHIVANMGVPQEIQHVTIENRTGVALSLGNPHVVFTVNHLQELDIIPLARHCQTHSLFPHSVNVGFMQIIDAQHILLRVYERGAGETLACGSGACAAAVAGMLQHQLHSPVTVQLTHGDLHIEWKGEGQPVWMTGRSALVFRGQWLG